MERHVLLVDAMPVVYSSYYRLKFLKNAAGESTGMRFGFMRAVNAAVKRFKAEKVVIAWDLPGGVKKAEDEDAGVAGRLYKANREVTAEKQEMYDQIPALKELLSLTWWTQVEAAGYESDDIIGSLARKLAADGHLITILSPDDDFSQLVSPQCSVYWSSKTGVEVKTSKAVSDKWGVPPFALLLYRVFEGDKSDNIAGMKMGKKDKMMLKGMIGKFFVTHKKMASGLASVEAKNVNFMAYQTMLDQFIMYSGNPAIMKFTASAQQNLILMWLTEPEQINIKKGIADQPALENLFDKLEFNSLKKDIAIFLKNTNG